MANTLKLEKPWDEVKKLLKEVEPSISDKDLIVTAKRGSAFSQVAKQNET